MELPVPQGGLINILPGRLFHENFVYEYLNHGQITVGPLLGTSHGCELWIRHRERTGPVWLYHIRLMGSPEGETLMCYRSLENGTQDDEWRMVSIGWNPTFNVWAIGWPHSSG